MQNTPTSHCKYSNYPGDLHTTTPTAQSRTKCHYNNYSNMNQLPTPSHQFVCTTPKSSVVYGTPSPMYNPFESDIEHLQHLVVTPGIFRKVAATPESKGKPFQWDIEHEAVLNPIDFGDVTEKLKKQDRYCRKIDQIAQGAIDKFFEKEHIVPSPWSEPVQKVNLLSKVEEEKSMTTESKRNASCQTDVHIPLSVDFSELFKDYRLSDSQLEELNKGESMNNSSLRRRLFRNGNESESSNSGHTTPEKLMLPPMPSEDCWKSPPLVELCASSPVFGQSSSIRSSCQRRCSFTITKPDFDGEMSPNLSPISSPEKLKSGFSHKGSVKSSPDIRESIQKLKAGLSFNLQDEFHLSNSGLLTETDSESDELMPLSHYQPAITTVQDGPAVMMSIDSHSFHQQHSEFHLDESDQNMLSIYQNKDEGDEAHADIIGDNNGYTEVSESVSMTSVMSERVVLDDFPQTMFGQSASDTGYQTASLNTLLVNDTSVAAELLKSQKSTCMAISPQKANNPGWEPSGASTPNKLSAIIDLNKDNLFKHL